MKYFAIIILPLGIDVTNKKMIEKTVAEMMRPYKMWEDDVPVKNARWDYYWCCTKEWMDKSQISYNNCTGIISGYQHIVFPAELINAEGVPDSVITPNGEWHRSNATYTKEDPAWSAEAIGICRSFPGHFAVLAFCHG